MATRLSTKDNPYNPFTQFDDWYAFDESHGYCTSGLLARIAKTSNELSDSMQESDTNEAIDTILELFPDGFYVKVDQK